MTYMKLKPRTRHLFWVVPYMRSEPGGNIFDAVAQKHGHTAMRACVRGWYMSVFIHERVDDTRACLYASACGFAC